MNKEANLKTAKPKDRPLRILHVAVENVLRLVSVDIKADGRIVELTGRNAVGKSSIVMAIWMALGGEKNIPEVPIHGDAEAGSILVEIGDDEGLALRVTRKLRRREDGSIATTLTVENAEGLRFQKPQEILNALLGTLAFDPAEFMRMPAKEQFDMLKVLVPGYDFESSAAADRADFTERTIINRRIKELRAQEQGIVIPDAPKERIDESALVLEMERAGQHNAGVVKAEQELLRVRSDVEALMRAVDTAEERVAEIQKELAAAEARAKRAREVADDRATELAAMPRPAEMIDVSDLRARVDAARQANAKFDRASQAAESKAALASRAAEHEAKAAALTKAMQDRGEAKMKAISAAKMPVAGLSFGDDSILYKGYPLSQASASEQRRVAIAIAASLNPRLRFAYIRDASLLDSEAWRDLERLCEEMNIFVWAETVESGRPSAVVIDDGRVKVPVMQAAE